MKRQQKKDLSKLHLFDLKKSLEWCQTALGIAPLKEVPIIRRHNKLVGECIGEDEEGMIFLWKETLWGCYDHDSNKIYINVSAHTCCSNLARTLIHEYVHYLQDLGYDSIEDDKTWDPNYTMKEDIYFEDGTPMTHSLIENEAEYHAVTRYKDLLTYLGYDYTHS